MVLRERVVAGVAGALVVGSLAGILVVRAADHGGRPSAAPPTTTTTAAPLPDTSVPVEASTPPTEPAAVTTTSTALPVVEPVTTATTAATTTTMAAGGNAALATDPATCAAPIAQPSPGDAVPADGVATLTFPAGAAHVVSPGGHQPSWRPGTANVLWMATAAGRQPGLCTGGSDGATRAPLSTPAGADRPVPSADGTQVAMRAVQPDGRVGLVVGSTDAATRRVLLFGADVTNLTWLGTNVLVACYTPTGGTPRIVRLPAIGGSPSTLRDGCPGALSGSPDGSRVAIATPTGLEVVGTDGRATTLARTGLLDEPPAWSPDSSKVAYTYAEDAQVALGVLDLVQGLATRLALGDAHRPSFSPKGDVVAYTGRGGGNGIYEVITVALAGGTPKALATCAGACLLPRVAWSSAGDGLVVESTPTT